MAGRVLVIDGLDGSGKATQTALFGQRLEKEEGSRPVTVSFPDYDSPSSALVKLYLSGQLGQADEVGAYAAASFYACDRFISYRQKWQAPYEAGATILCDRYVSSNLIHQMVKLPREEWDGFIRWLEDYEYGRLGLPRPQMVFYLDMDPAISRRLISGRYQGDESRRDIHEGNFDYLCRCHEAAAYAAKALGWQVIPCFSGEEPLAVEEISGAIWRTYLRQKEVL